LGPFIFVNADADAAPLADTLGWLPDIVRAGGIDVDAVTFHSRAPYSLAANWKVAVENYLECYHGAVAHEHGRLMLPSEELIGDFQRWVTESLA
jgi:phenylpropionate dioxygenase-like ring-hydroxylating dioxygenase large terminal subunit